MRRICALALLCALPAGIAAPAEAKRIRKPKIATHTDPGHKTKQRARRPLARSATLATTWNCTQTTLDRVPYLSNAPQIKVIYAYPTDRPNALATVGSAIQADANAIEAKVAGEPGSTKSIRFDVGGTGGTGDECTLDSSHRLDIQTVALANPSGYYSDDAYYKLLDELIPRLQPADPNQRVNYVVYLDDVHPPTDGFSYVLGQADWPNASQPGYDSPINQGRNGRGQLFALIYGYDGIGVDTAEMRRAAFLHEMSHTLGAVQLDAPHSSGAAHCYDGADVMCYDDGGSFFLNGGTLRSDCAGDPYAFTAPLDCNQNDYFDAAPAVGSYLATHWNEYDSVFLCPVSECDTPLPAFTATVTAGRDAGDVTFTADTGGVPIAHHEWDFDGDGFFETDTGSGPVVHASFASPGTKTARLRAVADDGSFAFAAASITLHEPVPSLAVSGNRVVGATITLDASGTSDPDGIIRRYQWDLDSNNTFETDSGPTNVVATSYGSAGTKHAGVQIDYGFGWTQTFASFDIAGATGPGPTGPSLGSGTGAGATVAPPSLSSRAIRLKRLLKSGLPLVVRCAAPCKVDFTLAIDAKTAKRLHLRTRRGKPVVIGRVRGQFIAGTVKPALKLTASAKAALRRTRSLKAKLGGSITQSGTPVLTIAKPLSFKR